MAKWRKRIPILVVTLSALALFVVALSFATTDDQKEDYIQQQNALRSTSQSESIHPDVAAKLAMEAEIQAKLEAEEEAELPTASRPAVQEDLKVNPFKTQPTMPAYTPRGEILWEGFETGSVPPSGWTAVVNNPYTWEIDSYNPFEGTYNASCFYDADYTGTQDEWLVSPVLNLAGKTDWKLEFAWMGSYYWSVDPYDNYDLEVWISTDGGANFTTKLWCEEDVGVFTSWEWYEATVNLSGYSTESNVKLGFRYYGYDGAQFSIDAISVNDEEAPIGRCCYDDPTAPLCADVTELECEAMGGYSWDEGLNCTDNPCPTAPPNDECVNAELIPSPFPATASGTTEGATIDCPGVLDWNAVWYKFDAPNECNDVVIDYCGSPYEIQCVGVVLYAACDDCPNYILDDAIEWLDCEGLTQPKIYWNNLPGPATYYIPVFLGDADCLPIESPFQLTLDIFECPPPEEGDNCSNPIKVDIPTLPWSDLNQTTCGRTNNYDGTCLGSYDGGEDIIYEVTVLSAVTVNITLDPKGEVYTGVAIGTDCPPTACVDYSTNYGSSPHGMTCVNLDPGVYYIMVDTWPSPDCIADFDLHIVDTTCEALENDNCADATPVGEVTDLPFSTDAATFDGGGTCLSSPNIWYCYTATESGDATISLCGSEYDTKMAVYDGCTCDPLGTELECNDDACGVQSEVVIPVTAGNSYLVEVGGYSSNTGNGILNISVLEPPPPCVVECPPGAFTEPEPCGDDVNGGCNMAVPAFTPIDCEDTVCGTIWADGGTRDTDWYELVLTELTLVTWSGVGEFPFVIGFVDTADCALAAAMDPYAVGDPCDTISCSRTCGPGIYWLFASHQDYYDLPCDDNNDYWCAVSCEPAVPTYCAASGGCDEYIERVEVGTIDNSSACEGYGDFTALSTEMALGTGYPITITTAGGYSSDDGAVWVDWNQDLDFYDDGERIPLDPETGYGPYLGTVTPPMDAVPGETRMRIRLSYSGLPEDMDPCGATSYGEVEDYTINVSGVVPPTYLFEPDPVLVLYKLSIDPMNGYIYLSGDAIGGDANDVSIVTLQVGTCVVPVSETVVITGGYGELTGDVLKITFAVVDYIVCEEEDGLVFDDIDSFFDVYYDLDGTPSEFNGQVTMVGHTSGDLNLDGQVNVADLTYLVNYLFRGGPAPEVIELADVNGSGDMPNVADLTYLVNYLFRGGSAPTHQ